MTSVFVVAPRPPEVDELIDERRRLGLDRNDELWDGVLHMVPGPTDEHASADADLLVVLHPRVRAAGLRALTACNIGRQGNYRVPDQAYFTPEMPRLLYHPTAAIVAEILSPYDESYAKLDFYYDADIQEVLFVDPGARSVTWFRRGEESFVRAQRSAILDISSVELLSELRWV